MNLEGTIFMDHIIIIIIHNFNNILIIFIQTRVAHFFKLKRTDAFLDDNLSIFERKNGGYLIQYVLQNIIFIFLIPYLIIFSKLIRIIPLIIWKVFMDFAF